MSHTVKLWEKVVEHGLRHETTISENQFGFMYWLYVKTICHGSYFLT